MNKAPLPKIVREAFPILEEATYYRDFVPLVPIYPDTTFGLFVRSSGEMLVLVTTDHPSPQSDSFNLKEVSGYYKFEFENIVRPNKNNEAIEILDHDDMDLDFFLHENQTYYYVVRLKQKAGELS